MRTIRSLGLLLTLALAGAIVAPAAVAFDETSSNGTVGLYTVNDFNGGPGVVCRYEDNAGAAKDELDRIVVKPLWSHGPFATKSWVGFRFIVKANKPPLADGIFKTVYRSPIVKRKANQTEIANFSGSWRAPEGTRSEYQVPLPLHLLPEGEHEQGRRQRLRPDGALSAQARRRFDLRPRLGGLRRRVPAQLPRAVADRPVVSLPRARQRPAGTPTGLHIAATIRRPTGPATAGAPPRPPV